MTVESTLNKITADGNDSATIFSFDPVTVFDSSDLVVTFVSTLGVETILSEGSGTTNYSVALSSTTILPSTGSITYPASLGTKLATGESLIIQRRISLAQNTDLGNQGGYFPEVQEAQFDRLAMVDMQQQDDIDRSIKLPVHIEDVSTELPDPIAGYGLVWNADADALTSVPLTITIDDTSLVVVAASTPAVVEGRIWMDTSVAGYLVIRVCDSADYNEIIRFNTTTGELTFADEIVNFSQKIKVSLTASGTAVNLVVTDTGTVGVIEDTEHISTSAAVNDVIWKKRFSGRNSTPAVKQYAEDSVIITDPTAASEDGVRDFQTIVAGTLASRLKIGAGIYTPAQADKGANTINASGLYVGGTPMAVSDVSLISATTHAPALNDHGKTFIYTAAAGCTVTMPDASTLFPGWKMTAIKATTTSSILFNRSSTDTIWSANTSLTAMRFPTFGDGSGGTFILDSVGGAAKFYFIGKRFYISADQTITAAGTLSLDHQLGVVPDIVSMWLHNVSNDLGYTGQTIPVDFGNDLDTDRGAALAISDSTLAVKYGSGANTFSLIKFDTGGIGSITNAKWKAIFKAIVIN